MSKNHFLSSVDVVSGCCLKSMHFLPWFGAAAAVVLHCNNPTKQTCVNYTSNGLSCRGYYGFPFDDLRIEIAHKS